MRKTNTAARVMRLVSEQKWRLACSVALTVLAVGANLLGPLLIGRAIDAMAGAGRADLPRVARFLPAIGATYLVYGLSLWLLSVLTNSIALGAANKLRRLLFEKLDGLSLRFFDSVPHGDTISRFVNDADTVGDGLLQSVSVFLTGAATIVGAVGFMLSLNALMAAIVALSAPAAYYVGRFVTRRSRASFKAQASILGRLNGYAEEMIDGAKVVQAFSCQEKSVAAFGAMNGELYEAGVRAQFYSSLTNPSTRLVNNIAYAVVGVVGALLALGGRLSVGGISSFLLYASIFSKPFNEVTGVIPQLQAAAASARRIFELLDRESEPEALNPEKPATPSRGEVVFEDVSFSYEPAKPLISGLSLRVEPGSRIAIVGSTGAGKTTLINLLMRFYDVDSGDIKIDGLSIYSMEREELRRLFGMVLQDTWLFAGTIRENLAYAREDSSDGEIVAAARASGAHNFIRRLPEGYDTPISGSGGKLSQGERQLLAVTRVMLSGAGMLILDEATSNIDTMSELNIQRAFDRMMEGRTSFVIAHRLSTVRNADVILVMDRGRIIERGSHEELLAARGAYSRLYESQFAKAQPL
jgi:ATP-binding cassette subfamily B protein